MRPRSSLAQGHLLPEGFETGSLADASCPRCGLPFNEVWDGAAASSNAGVSVTAARAP